MLELCGCLVVLVVCFVYVVGGFGVDVGGDCVVCIVYVGGD